MKGPLIKRVGIIGAGKIVEDIHLPILRNIKGIRVSWISDIDKDRLKLISKMYQVPSLLTPQAICELNQVDLCLIATPLGTRQSYLEACAQAGIAVYAEKPFAEDVAQHQYYCSLFPDDSLAAGFQKRFYQTTSIIREIVKTQIF